MFNIKENVYWIGKKDWDLRRFHGHELSTHRGSTYNSYFIKDKKTVLVDTVWDPYREEYINNLEKEIGLNNIDYIVVNHSEIDHAGSLKFLMEKIPNTPIYCTKSGAEIMKKQFHKDWNFQIVKTGDKLNIGKNNLIFVEMKMIHWPDSMMTFVEGANVLLSNDAFGQHFSPASLFNDEVDNCELYQEAIKYYANIVNPFNLMVKKKIEEVTSLNLNIEMIAPSHGVIWRENPAQIINKYAEWSNNYEEGFIAVIYDSMYNGTGSLAEAISLGLRNKGVPAKLFNSSVTDRSDLITELFKAKGFIIGSSTVNNGVLASIGVITEEIHNLKFKNKFGAAFGTYGWSGEGSKIIDKRLKEAGVKVINEPLAFKYMPTDEELKEAVRYGEEFAEKMNNA